MPDKNSKTLGFGIALTTGITIASRLLAVFVNLMVIKILSPSELGLFLGVQSMVYIGCGFCDLGLSHGYRQMASRDLSLRKTLLGPTVFIQFVMLLLYFLGLNIYMVNNGNFQLGTIFIAIGALSSQFPTVLGIDLYIVRSFKKAGILNLLSVLGLTLGVLFAWLSSNVFLALAIGYAIGMIGYSVCAILFVDRSVIQFSFTKKTLLQARLSFSFFMSMVITKFGLFFGLTYLLATQDSHAVGIVGFPLKIYQLCLLLSSVTTSVTLPHFHKLAQQNNKLELGSVLGKLIGPLWAIIGCVAGVLFLCPGLVVAIIGSNQYVESIFFLRILSIAILLKSLSIPAGNLLESRNLQWLRVVVQALSSSIMVLSVLVLFPKYGLKVVAYSVLVADAVSFVLLWGFNAVEMAHCLPWRKHILGAIALIIALSIAWAASFNNILTMPLFVGVYLSLVTLLGVCSPFELANKIFGKN